MVKVAIATSLAIIQLALLSQTTVGIPVESKETHCKRADAGTTAGLVIGCLSLGAVTTAAGVVFQPGAKPGPGGNAHPEAANPDGQAAHSPPNPVHSQQYQSHEGMHSTPHQNPQDPDAITPAPPLPVHMAHPASNQYG